MAKRPSRDMIGRRILIRRLLLSCTLFAAALLGTAFASHASDVPPPEDQWVEVGETGFGTNRLVIASACPEACPWGELGEFVQEAMAKDGYDIILCRNCNRTEGPRIVGNNTFPPALVADDYEHGTTGRIHARIDFGITEALMFKWAYQGAYLYARDGPFQNLRLLAHIEDPTYLLVAVKPELGITSLAEIRERHMPVRILADTQPSSAPVLQYYGLDRASVESWGGSYVPMRNITEDTDFDVVISSLGSPANNPESAYWTTLTVAHDLKFLDLDEELMDQMVENIGMRRVTARWGVLRGVDRPIRTVGRSGEVVFARDDMPEQVAYDIARAIDRERGELIWFARPYSIDPRTVANGNGVPLHPGAERYYREIGYLD